MTYDEVKTRLTDLVGSPDTAAEKAVDFLKDLEEDYTTLDSMTQKVTESEERIRNLQDTNQRLFLSVTGQPKNDDPATPPEPGIDWEAMKKELTADGK